MCTPRGHRYVALVPDISVYQPVHPFFPLIGPDGNTRVYRDIPAEANKKHMVILMAPTQFRILVKDHILRIFQELHLALIDPSARIPPAGHETFMTTNLWRGHNII